MDDGTMDEQFKTHRCFQWCELITTEQLGVKVLGGLRIL
jgi:hypothetical protein